MGPRRQRADRAAALPILVDQGSPTLPAQLNPERLEQVCFSLRRHEAMTTAITFHLHLQRRTTWPITPGSFSQQSCL